MREVQGVALHVVRGSAGEAVMGRYMLNERYADAVRSQPLPRVDATWNDTAMALWQIQRSQDLSRVAQLEARKRGTGEVEWWARERLMF